jgi:hypothetical protein
LGIHPSKSPICYSAIVDKTVSIYGGVLQVVKFKKENNLEFINIENSNDY